MTNPRGSRSAYLFNAWADVLLIGGLSLPLLLGVLLLGLADPERADVARAASVAAWVIYFPHFGATGYRLYSSRRSVARFPMTAAALPGLLALAMAACFAWPERVAPMFVKLFLMWSPYHTSAQTIGIALLYARRFGFRFESAERRALSAFVFGTLIQRWAVDNVGAGGDRFSGVWFPSLRLPEWAPLAMKAWMYGAGALFLVLLARRYRRGGRSALPPWICLVPPLAQYGWFISWQGYRVFLLFLPLFHALQYMAVAGIVHLGARVGEEGLSRTTRSLAAEGARWYAANVGLGALLFYLLPKALTPLGPSAEFAQAIVIAGVQIHHFFVDGVVWKLGQALPGSPLLFGWSDRLSPAGSPVPTQGRRAA